MPGHLIVITEYQYIFMVPVVEVFIDGKTVTAGYDFLRTD